MPAVTALFAGINPPSHFTLSSWSNWKMVRPPGWEVYMDCWDEVYKQASGSVTVSWPLLGMYHFSASGSSDI